MLCRLILYVSGGTYSLKSTPNDRFLRNFSWQFYFTPTVFARNLLRVSHRRNIFHISWQVYLLLNLFTGICWEIIAVGIFLFFSYFGFDAFSWDMNPGFMSNKPTLLFFLIGHSNPSVRIIDLISHTTYVVCVNFTLAVVTV